MPTSRDRAVAPAAATRRGSGPSRARRAVVALVAALVATTGALVIVPMTGAGAAPGDTWTVRSAPTPDNWIGVTYGNGLFVAVPDGAGAVMTSPDGVTWTAHPAPYSRWVSVTYGNGVFVAVSLDGGAMTSPDGINWTSQATPEPDPWRTVVYANGQFVAVANSGGQGVMTSPDGITWTAATPAEYNYWFGLAFGNGVFAAVSPDGTHRVMTSPDGVTWTPRLAAVQSSWISVTYADGQFVAVATDGTDQVMTSPDGITWTAHTAPNGPWHSVTYGDGVFVAVGDTDQVMTSPDGITWTAQTAAEHDYWYTVAYAGGLFVAVAPLGASHIMTSGTFATPTTTTAITGDSPDPSYAGAAYTVSGTVTVSGTTPPIGDDLPEQVAVTGDGTGCTDTTLAATADPQVYEFSCAITDGTLGAKTLTATYSGATGLVGSLDTESHEVRTETTTVITADTPDPSYAGFWYDVSGTVTVNGTPPVSGNLPGTVVVTGDNATTCTDPTLVPTGTAAEYGFACTVKGSYTAGAVQLSATYTDAGATYATSTSTAASHQIDAAPPAPTGVVATTPGAGSRSTTVSWTPPAQGPTPTGYQIRCIPVGVPFDTGPSTNPDTRWVGSVASPVTVSGLTRGLQYRCMVRARYGPEYASERGDAYEGPLSTWSNTVTVPIVKPPAPTGVKATVPKAPNPRSTVVTWTPVANNTGAAVSFTTTCTSTNGGVTRSATGNSPVVVTTLTRGKTYTCKVTATNTAGSSTSTASNTIKVP